MANGYQIDFNLFVVLEAIYVEGSVTRAADKLNLSQPAISHALARLRELFGDPLFVRKGNAMVPTPLTRNNIESIRNSLRLLENSIRESSHFDPANAEKRFSLCLPSSMESALLPLFWQRLAAQAPRLDLVINRSERQRMESKLAAGVFDVALDVLVRHSSEVLHQRVLSERLVVVARRDHPQLRPGFDLDTYLQQQHILISTRREGPGIVDVELDRLGVQRRIRLRCQQNYSACRIVSESDLVLTMLEFDARAANRPFDNQILPLPLSLEAIDIFLYWHASMESDAASRWLRGEIASTCADMASAPPTS